MDQVKEYLEVLKKHHFWVLCGVVLIAAAVAYRSGANTLAQKYSSRKASLESKFNDVSRVSSTPDHPNQSFVDGVGVLNGQEKKLTLEAWQMLYEKQKKILTWPPLFQSISKLPPNAVIDPSTRDAYVNYAKDQLPKLLDIVQVRRTVNTGEGQNKEVKAVGLVVWDQDSRDSLEQLFDFSGRPSSKHVRYTQEALWVYKALLDVIAKTNQGATAFYNVPIKKIEELSIAQAANMPPDSDVELPSSGTPQSTKPESAPTVPAGDATDEELGEGRYVNEQGKPVPAAQAESGEFKLMPILMKLVMDQRKIPDLLINCANSELLVEVRRLRVNPEASGTRKKLSNSSRGTRSGTNRNSNAGSMVEGPYDVTVELRGLIYIYNRPDRQKLGVVDNVASGGAPSSGGVSTGGTGTAAPVSAAGSPGT